jgi:hypothetical protein
MWWFGRDDRDVQKGKSVGGMGDWECVEDVVEGWNRVDLGREDAGEMDRFMKVLWIEFLQKGKGG